MYEYGYIAQYYAYYAKPGTHHMSWLLSFVCGYKTVHVYTLFSASEVNIKHACAVIMQAL